MGLLGLNLMSSPRCHCYTNRVSHDGPCLSCWGHKPIDLNHSLTWSYEIHFYPLVMSSVDKGTKEGRDCLVRVELSV